MFLCIRWRTASRTGDWKMEPLSVSINDAAKALGLGRTSIYMMIGDGRLESFKVGRRTLIKSSSIVRFVNASTVSL